MASKFFPTLQYSTPDGLAAVGGELSVERLLDAYRHGIFPWPSSEIEPMLWWSPDPRAILPLGGLHVSRRLQRRLQRDEFAVTCDRDFAGVIAGCATGPDREGGTWITPQMEHAYRALHRRGQAHSVEAWQDAKLVGGVYGVSVGALFAAESMFYRVRDASKVALFHLVQHLVARGYQLLDIQQLTPHTARLGAVEISRDEYLNRLATAVDRRVTFGDRLEPARTTR